MPEKDDRARAYLAGEEIAFEEAQELWKGRKKAGDLATARALLERIREGEGLLDRVPREWGLGAIASIQLISDSRAQSFSHSVGTTIFILLTVDLIVLVGRFNQALLNDIQNNIVQLQSILFWVIPAVIIGGQVGPNLARKLPGKLVLPYVGSIMIMTGSIILFNMIHI